MRWIAVAISNFPGVLVLKRCILSCCRKCLMPPHTRTHKMTSMRWWNDGWQMYLGMVKRLAGAYWSWSIIACDSITFVHACIRRLCHNISNFCLWHYARSLHLHWIPVCCRQIHPTWLTCTLILFIAVLCLVWNSQNFFQVFCLYTVCEKWPKHHITFTSHCPFIIVYRNVKVFYNTHMHNLLVVCCMITFSTLCVKITDLLHSVKY